MDSLIRKFSCLIILSCFSTDYVHGIVGGREPKDGEARYHIVFQWKKAKAFDSICGGGIIGEKYILTAAHCVINGTTNQFFAGSMRIIAGTRKAFPSDLWTNTVRDVKRIMIPNNYAATTADNIASNDIAVLELKEKLNLMEEITTISPITKQVKKMKKLVKLELPNDKNAPKSNSGQVVKLMGSGTGIDSMVKTTDKQTKKEHYNPNRSGKMQVAAAVSVENDVCQKQWRKNMVTQVVNLKDEHLCAKVVENQHRAGIRGFCRGDSGSPLVYNKNVVIGILSVGPEPSCNTDERAAVFAKVEMQKQFIANAMKYDTLTQNQQKKIRVHVLP